MEISCIAFIYASSKLQEEFPRQSSLLGLLLYHPHQFPVTELLVISIHLLQTKLSIEALHTFSTFGWLFASVIVLLMIKLSRSLPKAQHSIHKE